MHRLFDEAPAGEPGGLDALCGLRARFLRPPSLEHQPCSKADLRDDQDAALVLARAADSRRLWRISARAGERSGVRRGACVLHQSGDAEPFSEVSLPPHLSALVWRTKKPPGK